ncbi:hypothetical protein Dimus_007566 [Dionaea muscipula]
MLAARLRWPPVAAARVGEEVPALRRPAGHTPAAAHAMVVIAWPCTANRSCSCGGGEPAMPASVLSRLHELLAVGMEDDADPMPPAAAYCCCPRRGGGACAEEACWPHTSCGPRHGGDRVALYCQKELLVRRRKASHACVRCHWPLRRLCMAITARSLK